MASLRETLTDRMKAFFAGDPRFVDHALQVLGYADRMRAVEGGDEDVVTAAALLHDVGIPESLRKYNSAAGKYQEIEGPPIAQKILDEVGLDAARVDHVCGIVADHHSGRNMDTLEFRILWDADQLVNIPNERPNDTADQLRRHIEAVFRTDTGRAIALERLIKD